MPIGGVNRPQGTTVGSVEGATEAEVAAPAAPATTPQPTTPGGWAPRTGGTAGPATPAAPSRLEEGADKLKGKATAFTLNQAANNHDLGTGFGAGVLQGNVKLSEEVGLKGTKVHKSLVEDDRRRNEYEKATPDAVWVQTGAMLGASAGFPIGPGATLGFSGSVQVTSIAAQHVENASDAGSAIAAQAKSMVLPLDAEGLQSLNAAPGSEWVFKGEVGSSIGIGIGTGVSSTAGGVTASANIGINATATANEQFTKNVKVLEGSKVYVQVAKVGAETAGVSVGLTAGVSIEANGKGAAGKLENRAGDAIEDKTKISASISAGANAGQKVMGSAVLDLSKPADREAYNYIVKATPNDAANFIKSQNLGPQYTESSRGTSTAATFEFGSAKLLSTSTMRGTTEGVVVDQGATTLLSQADYGRNVEGFLPRLVIGEERNVTVRAGSVTKDGVTQKALALNLAIKDPKLDEGELAEMNRFSKAMGTPLEGLPTAAPGGDVGKAEINVSMALTDPQVQKLASWNSDSLKLAFANAQREIEGSPTMPPWFDQPAAFEAARKVYNTPASGGPRANNPNENKMKAERAYEQQFPGRDLGKDIASERASTVIAKQIDGAREKPVGEWGKVLEAVGKQQSNDIRTSMLALKRLTGADVVGLSVNAQGKTIAATPQGAAPKSIAELVGTILGPPE